MKIVKPNYENGSIVNLMSSITKAMGDEPMYEPLPVVNSDELSEYKNIVLLIIDGLGYDYLQTRGKNSVFYPLIKDKITSVFPPTTSAAITSFLTGVAPQQHAITGWFMYLKELGVASKILPFSPKYGGDSFDKFEIKAKDIIEVKTIFEKINRKSYYITPASIKDSANTRTVGKGAERLGYNNLNGFIRQTKRAIKKSGKKKFVYAYWSEFDHLCHKHGTESNEVSAHFQALNEKVELLINWLKDKDAILIITADHGMMDSKDKTIHMKNHPRLRECLTLPLCGEPRAAYCYVHPSKVEQFEAYITHEMSQYCELFRSEELIEQNFFGLHKQDKKLFDRVGDYTLLMKDDYIIKHYVLGEEEYNLIGNHGGISEKEMVVPLMIV